MNSSPSPLVSVCCVTYNHQDFIREAIEGFLSQKTNFPFEIIIHDDASTDRTPSIIKEYTEKFPDLFIPIFQKENQYSKKPGNILFLHVLPKIRGKYVALCEGDDYWIDPLKLQKQVDFLESHSDYGLVYTNALIHYQETGHQRVKGGIQYSSFEHLLSTQSSQIATLTVMFRTDLFVQYKEEIKPETKSWLMADYPLWLYISRYSKLKYMVDITAVYRYLKESASHFVSSQKTFEFVSSGYDVKMFFVSKYQMNSHMQDVIKNIYYKKSIYLAILNNNLEFVKECISFLSRHKMKIENLGVRLLVILYRIKIPINLFYKVLFHSWRVQKSLFTNKELKSV